MKKNSITQAAGAKSWPFLNEKANDAYETLKERLVLQDECGDTLWDELLALQDAILYSKNYIENGGECNSSDKINSK
ncbi:MAG: hypothetical protein H7Y86_09450 [Rhizobacter sp.]|nr:hypothetical protein [Ferruginibacter sp.]